MAKINIMVVDDLRSMRLTLGAILEDAGHNVVTVENGYEAIEAARRTHFDAIFMDIKMPGINGVQTFREVKKIDPKTAVIMMTAYSLEDLVREALEEGAYAVINKPFDMDKIISIIGRLADKALVMVVDDQFGDRETLGRILEGQGYRVASAPDGIAAIDLARNEHYDIIFLDIKLPDIDGVQVLEQVKKIDPRTAVIMMTGYSVEDLVRKAIERGACTCLYKPFDTSKVIGLVEEICGQPRA